MLGWDTPGVPPTRRLQAQSVAPTIVWFRDREPERWRQTSKILGVTGYVVHRLTVLGDFSLLAEGWVRIGRTVRPNPQVTAVYDQYYRVYRRLYERTAEDMHELARLSAIQP